MNDDILKKLIKNTIDNLPIPWEQLWMVFQRIMQCMPQSVPALEGEKQGKIEKKSDKEKHVTNQSKQVRGRNLRCFVPIVERNAVITTFSAGAAAPGPPPAR